MKYAELTVSEKKELRDTLWNESIYHDGYTDFDHLSTEEQDIVSNCEFSDDIPESVMESAYGMYDFVEDDFFCNTDDQFCDRLGNEIVWKHQQTQQCPLEEGGEMKRFRIGGNQYGGIYRIRQKKANGKTYRLIEESDALGDAVYHIELEVIDGWHERVGKNFNSINDALKAFDVVELFI